MKLLTIAVLAMLSLSAFSNPGDKVIYGNDDRQDVVNVFDNMLIDKARSTAGMFSSGNLTKRPDGAYNVTGQTLVQRGWCSNERFASQITAPVCTGFLLGDDVIATAGHCVAKSSDCKNYKWVFDFKIANPSDTSVVVPASSVYGCKSIISTVNSNSTKDDYAIIRLDRKVTDRAVLEYRKSGKVADGASLVMIGHPKGLPMKIAGGAKVRTNTATKYFVANLDSYGGNSGSPIFDAITGVVEGILVRGESDYTTTSTGCYTSYICSDSGCRGEDVTRITNLPRF